MKSRTGTSLRIFVLNDDGSLSCLSRARYERLLRREPEERVPEYAGRRVRCAVVVLDTLDEKPIAVSRVVYSFLPFDANGRIDMAEREKETRLALELTPPSREEEPPGQVIDARHHFAKRRYAREYRWRPSPEIEAAILDTVFGRDTPL